MRGTRFGVTLAALAVRLVAFVRQPELTYDGTYYLRQAERLAAGGYDFAGFPPGYPLVVALLRPLCGDWVLAARIASLAASVAVVPLAMHLAARRLSRGWVLVVGLFLALHPQLARTGVETMTESLHTLLVVAAVVGFEARRDLAAGALLGAAFWVRPEALVLHLALVALRAVQLRRVPWALAAGLVLPATYSALASHAVGAAVVTPKQGQLDLGPAIFGRTATLVHMLHRCFPIVLLPGAIAWGWRRAPALLAPVAYTLAWPFFAVHVQERVHLPALPFWAVLGAGWLAGLAPRIRRVAVAVAGVSFAFGAATGYRQLAAGYDVAPHARSIGRALHPSVERDARIAARFPMVPYFAGAGFVRAPRELGYTELLDSVQAAGATHLLVLENEIGDVLPQLRPLFENADAAIGEGRLALAASVDAPPGRRALLYRVQSAPLDTPRAVADGAQSVAWFDTILVVERNGLLEGPFATPIPGSDPCGTTHTLAFVHDGRICTADARGNVARHDATHDDAPASPAWVGDGAVLYVRTAAPRGLRGLDLATGRVRRVALAGVSETVGTPLRVAARGRDVAIVYAPPQGARRILATGTWPEPAGAGDVVLRGRWATDAALFDDGVGWTPEDDALLVSLSGVPGAVQDGTLALVLPGGRLRRLTSALAATRRPACRAGEIAFVCGAGQVRRQRLDPTTLRVPPVRVFPPSP